MDLRKTSNIALFASLGLVAVVFTANIVWIDVTGANHGRPVDPAHQTMFYTAGWIAMLALLGSLIFWAVVHLIRRRTEPDPEGTEALLALTQRAGEYLQGIHLLLWVAGLYLIAFGFILIPFGDNLGMTYQSYSDGIDGWITLLLGSFWTATFIVWIIHLVRVRRELRRWRRTTRELPFHD